MEEFELEPGEEIVETVRQHMFVLIVKLLPFVILAFAPSILLAVFAAFTQGTSVSIPTLSGGLGRFITGAYLLFLWIGAFTTFTRYYLTQWVITNLRIVDIKQYGFFNREVSSFLLIRVQDMTTDISGLVGTLVEFGRLDVETAGSTDKFSMDGVAHPDQLRDVIMGQVAALHTTGDPMAMQTQSGV